MPTGPAHNAYDGPRNRLNALIETSLAMIGLSDLRALLGRILDLATHHVGADRGALFLRRPDTGRLVATIFHGDELAFIDLPEGQGIAGEVARTGEPVRIEDAYEDPRFDRSVDERTGYRTRSLLCVPMRHRDGTIIGVMELLNKIDDGTFDPDDEEFSAAFGAQAAMAISNARLVEDRIRGERLEAVGTMAAKLVHDLRNPLSGVHGYSDVILQNPPDELRDKAVGGIRRQVTRMNHMVASILRYVRGEGFLLFANVDLDEVMGEIVEDLRAAHAGDAVEIHWESDRVGTLRADGMAIRRLIDNLARNAVEAMADTEGGTLRITTRREDPYALIEVTDNGPGMENDQARALFATFATSGKKEGTGLGLAIVRQIVTGHAGTVDVRSEPGEGTTVTIRLPIRGTTETGGGGG